MPSRRSFRALMQRWYGEHSNISPEPEATLVMLTAADSSTCRRRLWLSEFQALPDDTLEAEMLRQRRAKRTLCMCSLTARAKEDL
jgi:hypothetical protein